MISLQDYTSHDALGLADLVARREVTAAELADASRRAAEKVNGELNAVLQALPPSEGESDAKGPFAGVPFMIKELILHAKGVRCDMGSKLAQGYVARADTELMARFRRAGLVLVGTTQTPELGYNPTTETKLFGPVRNPWDTNRSAGGSSGGTGASVAAGIVPIGHASDGGGSIRIPASCNGLFGLKPTRDRVPSGPDYADLLCGLAIEFALARSVRDAAALLDAVAGPDVGAPGHLTAPAGAFGEAACSQPRKLRIAWTTTPASGAKVHPECAQAVYETVHLLEDLGHEVVEDAPRYDWDAFLQSIHVIWTAFTAMTVDALARVLERKAGPENLEAVTWACYQDGARWKATDLLAAIAHGNVVSRTAGAFFVHVDAFLTPTMAALPAVLGELDQDRPGMTAMEWTQQVFAYVPFTPLYNTTGQPAMSVPLHWSAEGVPVGVQFGGRFGDEAGLLQLAAQLEEARPWAKQRPPLHAGA